MKSGLEARALPFLAKRYGSIVRGERVRLPLKPFMPDFFDVETRTIIFINSCFYHGCPDHFRPPKTNAEFWQRRIEKTRERDREGEEFYRKNKYPVVTFWQHEIDNKVLANELKSSTSALDRLANELSQIRDLLDRLALEIARVKLSVLGDLDSPEPWKGPDVETGTIKPISRELLFIVKRMNSKVEKLSRRVV